MLGKLMKYDLGALSRILIPLHLAAVAVIVVGAGAGLTGHWVSELPAGALADPAEGAVLGLAVLVLLMAVLALGCLSLATLAVVLWRFYRNLFTDEGYLTLTLPATPAQQVWSKVLAGLIWMVVDAVVVFAGLLVVMAAAEGFGGATDLEDTLPYWILSYANGHGFGGVVPEGFLGVAGTLLQTLVQMAFGLLMAYAAFALGAALAARHKVAAGIGLYVALSWGYGLLSGAVGVLGLFAVTGTSSMRAYYALTSVTGTVLQLAACGVFWLICVWVLRRKVNLP